MRAKDGSGHKRKSQADVEKVDSHTLPLSIMISNWLRACTISPIGTIPIVSPQVHAAGLEAEPRAARLCSQATVKARMAPHAGCQSLAQPPVAPRNATTAAMVRGGHRSQSAIRAAPKHSGP